MDTEEIETPWGLFRVPTTSTGMINKIRRTGGFELFKLRRMFLWSRIHYLSGNEHPGLFLDVGANVGTTSIPALQSPLVSRVVALEPVREISLILKDNIDKNQNRFPTKSATVLNMAAGSWKGRSDIYLHPTNNGDNRLESPGPGLNWNREEIWMDTLDNLFEEASPPDFVWVDAQGWETEILRGAEKLRQKEVPWFLEFWPGGLRDSETFFQITRETCSEALYVSTQRRFPTSEIPDLFRKILNRGPMAHTDLFMIH